MGLRIPEPEDLRPFEPASPRSADDNLFALTSAAATGREVCLPPDSLQPIGDLVYFLFRVRGRHTAAAFTSFRHDSRADGGITGA